MTATWKLEFPYRRSVGPVIALHRGGAALGELPALVEPIGASGMLRFAEAALQVRGAAGEHQIDGARLALGHAYSGAAQYFAMWVVGADQP
jgi:acetyl-CoA C-acetyltransferase